METLSTTAGYIILAVFSIISILLGKFFAGKSEENVDDFLAARESVPLPVAIAGLIAVWVWSSTIMGAGEGAYQFGMAGLWMYGLSVLVSALLLGAPLLGRVRKMIPQASTFPQFMAIRLGKSAHKVFTFVGVWQMFFWSVLQVMAVGMVLNTMFGIPTLHGALLSGIVISVYITLGGLRAAAGTGYFQVLVITVLLAIIVPFAVIANGGTSAIYAGVANSGVKNATAIITQDSIFDWLLVSIGSYLNYTILDQNVWQYVFSIKPGQERKLILTSTLLWLVIPSVSGLLGIIALGAAINTSPSVAIPAMILGTLPKWLSYAFALVMLSSIYSTAGSCLNAFTSLVINDIYVPYICKNNVNPKNLLPLAKKVTLVGGILVSILSVAPISLLSFNYAVGAIAVPLTWPFVFAVIWEKLNTKATLYGIWAGIACGIYLAFLPAVGLISSPVPLWQGYAITHLVSAIIPIVGTLISPNNSFSFDQLANVKI